MEQQIIRDYILEMAKRCDETPAFAADFANRLFEDEKILEEFIFFAQNNNFACKEKIAGVSVVDVLIWQMDHFKATLDRPENGMKTNGNKMVLRAFDTFLKMRDNPEPTIRAMQGETGTDFPGKYQ